MFTKWLKQELERINKLTCPEHLECGAQDAWQENVENTISDINIALAVCYSDTDKFPTEESYETARAIYSKLLKEFLEHVEYTASENERTCEYYVEEKFHRESIA